MSLPAKFRKVLSDELVVVRELEDQCIYVFETDDYEQWIDRLFEQRFGGFDETSRMHLGLRRQLKARATAVEVDASGRIGLPQEAREKVGIDKEVVVLGNTGRFEVWAPDRYQADSEEFDLSLFYQS
ncbi:MAG: division/cell wall cluster transcriptional repressor MraZ [Eggerthellaceae bacterium]|nr:division/cell wall cluster transcriptional repressor MraZ [Eggerthellaceae bacterium]